MDNKKIIELVEAFSREDLKSLSIKDGDFEINLEKDRPEAIENFDFSILNNISKNNIHKPTVESIEEDSFFKVRAPLVGIFYTSPAPGENPFVKVGDRINKGDTLCIIEAMKMINEIPSPVSGVIKNIKYLNEELVQFDSVIMEIDEND